MVKKGIVLLIISFILVLFIGCGDGTYRALNSFEIDNFLQDKNIKALTAQNIGEFTVVMYETENEIGHYILSINKSGKLYSEKQMGSRKSDTTPIFISNISGKVNFTSVYLKDDDLMQKAQKISIELEDGYSETKLTNKERGVIIPLNNVKGANQGSRFIVIYDSNDKIIYTGKCMS